MYVGLCPLNLLEVEGTLSPSLMTIQDTVRCTLLGVSQKCLRRFKEFELCVTTQCGNSIAPLRTDSGGEYLSNDFNIYLNQGDTQ